MGSPLPNLSCAAAIPTSLLEPLLLCPVFACSRAAQVPVVRDNQQHVGGTIPCPGCGEPMMLVHYATTAVEADWGMLRHRAVTMRAELRR